MKTGVLTATRLRLILSIILVVTIAAAAVGFVYGRGILEKYAVEVSRKQIDAKASNGTIQSLREIESTLENNQEVIKKAQSLKAANELPQFQIVDDVTRHANNNGIEIVSFNFGQATPATTTSPASKPEGAAAPNAAAGGVSLTVTLESPINYTKLLQFLHDIENNIPKMQAQGVYLASPADGSGGLQIEPIVIRMYTR